MSEKTNTILFKMNGCGHCESLKGDWNNAVKEISQQNGGKIGSVDGYNTIKNGKHSVEVVDSQNEHKKTKLENTYNGGKSFNVSGYPTIKRCSKQGVTEYNGPRTKEAIMDFIKNGKTTVAVGGKRRTKKQKNSNKNTRKNRGKKSLGNWWNKLF